MDKPYVTKELLEELNRMFPNRSPEKDETHSDLMWRGGQRSVVDYLTMLREEQELFQETL